MKSTLPNKVAITGLSLLTLGCVFAFAQAPNVPQHTSTTPSNADFCLSIDTYFDRVNQSANSLYNMNQFAKYAPTTKSSILIGNIDAKRVEITALRKLISNELSRRATSSSDKQALALFATSIDEASQRKDARIATIIDKLENDKRDMMNKRTQQIAKATSTLNQNITKAKATARRNCEERSQGVDAKAIFKRSVDQATANFSSSLKSIEYSPQTTNSIKDPYKKEIDAVMKSYKDEIDQAKNTLKKSFTTIKSI